MAEMMILLKDQSKMIQDLKEVGSFSKPVEILEDAVPPTVANGCSASRSGQLVPTPSTPPVIISNR